MSEDIDIDAEILAAQAELEALEKEAGGDIDAEILAAQKELDSLQGGQSDIDEEIRRAELELQKLERERAEEAKKEQEKRRTLELKRSETEAQRLAEVQKKKDDLRRRIEEEERVRKQQEKEEEERRVVIARKIEEERKKKLEQQARAQAEQRSKLEEDKRKYEEMQKARAATLSNSSTASHTSTSSANTAKEPARTTGQPAKKIDETEIERLQNEMIQQRRSLLMEKYIDDYDENKPKQYSFLKTYPNAFSEESVIETAPDVTPDVSFKVIVIGDSGVGKSNMLNRWIKGCFGSETIIATTQCAFHQKTFRMKAQDAADRDRIVAVRLWDTAGQERFLSLTRQFFRGAVGVVVVYDTTARESFTHVQKWLNAVEEEVSDTNMILIGNKTDLVHSREVDKSEGIQWAAKNNMSFLETSALDGSNCSRALQILLQDIYERHLTKKSLANGGNGADAESEAGVTALNASGGQVLSSGDEEKSDCAC